MDIKLQKGRNKKRRKESMMREENRKVLKQNA